MWSGTGTTDISSGGHNVCRIATGMSRPNNAPAYYLGRPAGLWLSLGRRRRLRTMTISVPRPRLPMDERVLAISGGRRAPG